LKNIPLTNIEFFVVCRIILDKEKHFPCIHQPKFNLICKFGILLEGDKVYATPAGPCTSIVRPSEGDTIISRDEQTKYKSGVGMLRYLIKHSKPDLSNSEREWSYVDRDATLAQWKALMQTIKYTIDTKTYALRLKPRKQIDVLYFEGISDCEFSGDKNTKM
jgi:hypothetical protein